MMMVTRLVPQLIPTIPTIPEPCLTKAEMITVNAKEEYYMRAWVCNQRYGIGWHRLDVCISLDEKIKEKGGIVVLWQGLLSAENCKEAARRESQAEGVQRGERRGWEER